jgi:hypothetical protein
MLMRRADDLFLDSQSNTFIQYMENALFMLEDRITRLGTGYTISNAARRVDGAKAASHQQSCRTVFSRIQFAGGLPESQGKHSSRWFWQGKFRIMPEETRR